jgi:hypothetical protein
MRNDEACACGRAISKNFDTLNPNVMSDADVRIQANIVRSYAMRVRSNASFVPMSSAGSIV